MATTIKTLSGEYLPEVKHAYGACVLCMGVFDADMIDATPADRVCINCGMAISECMDRYVRKQREAHPIAPPKRAPKKTPVTA